MAAGDGAPTVVFESGMGFSRSAWGLVQPLVAQRFRSVVYDRANLGRSDDDPQPRTLERITADLGALLTALGPGPFILVGHSYGGTIALSSTVADPDRIAGIVLVDHSDENLDAYFRPASPVTRVVGVANRAALSTVGWLGLMPQLARWTMPKMPTDVVEDMIAEDFTWRGGRGADEEDRRFVAGMTALRDDPPMFEGIPVTVISGVRSELLNEETRSELNVAHQLTVQRLGARHVLARKSGHQVVLTEPRLIADEVFRVADA
ncbi:alpha/beta hydrolase [Mycobacterium sp. CBMA271]|nr:alpha/beta hydrolase [Mycobacteroides sp. CBMA 271]